MTPSVAKLEAAMYTYLQQQLGSRAKVSSTHPPAGSKTAVVVLGFVSDTASYQARSLIEPSLQFVAYDTNYAKARQLQEQIISIMDGFTPPTMQEQQITSYRRVTVAGVDYDENSTLYFAMAEYRFSITAIGV